MSTVFVLFLDFKGSRRVREFVGVYANRGSAEEVVRRNVEADNSLNVWDFSILEKPVLTVSGA